MSVMSARQQLRSGWTALAPGGPQAVRVCTVPVISPPFIAIPRPSESRKTKMLASWSASNQRAEKHMISAILSLPGRWRSAKACRSSAVSSVIAGSKRPRAMCPPRARLGQGIRGTHRRQHRRRHSVGVAIANARRRRPSRQLRDGLAHSRPRSRPRVRPHPQDDRKPSGTCPLDDRGRLLFAPVNCCRYQRCFALKSILGKLAALIYAVPLSALTHDPLVVT